MSAPTKAQTPEASTHELWQKVEVGDVRTRSRRFNPDGIFHDFSDSDEALSGSNQKVRTLHDPPDIWNLVPETRVEFNPRSAFVGHISSLKHVVLFVIMLIVGAVAAFGFMKLWDSAANHHAGPTAPAPSSVPVASTTPAASSSPFAATAAAEAALQTDDGKTTIASSSPVTEPETTTLSSTEQATSKSEIAGSKVDAKVTVAAPAAPWVPARQVVTKRPRENRLGSAVIGQAAVASMDEKDKIQTSATPGPKSDSEKADSLKAAQKEENKSPNPQLTAPAKASATPKPKVIQWP